MIFEDKFGMNIRKYANSLKFHMPGHNYKEHCKDLTEHNYMESLLDDTKGVYELKEFYRELYGARALEIGTCGSTSLIGATLAYYNSIIKAEEKRLILPRNSHLSIINWAREYGFELDFLGDISLGEFVESTDVLAYENWLAQNEDETLENCVFVFYTPTYDGDIKDYRNLYKKLKDRGANIFLDCAHGGALVLDDELKNIIFSDYPDFIIVSAHKTLGSLTQGALLLTYGKNVKLDVLNKKYRLTQTTSPNYEIIYSMAKMALFLQEFCKSEEFKIKTQKDIYESIANIENSLTSFLQRCFEKTRVKKFKGNDRYKLGIEFSNNDGLLLLEYLKLNDIYVEYGSSKKILIYMYPLLFKCLADTKEIRDNDDFKKIFTILDKISNREQLEEVLALNGYFEKSNREQEIKGKQLEPKGKTDDKEYKLLALNKALGMKTYEDIILYPPGIIVLLEGECVTKEIIEKLAKIGKEEMLVRIMI